MTSDRSDPRRKSPAPYRKNAGGRKEPQKRDSLEENVKKAEKAYRILYALYNDSLSPDARNAAKAQEAKGQNAGESPSLTIRFQPDGDATAFARQWIETIRSDRPDSEACRSFAKGHVYCYHCDSIQCEHTSPPDHLSVFSGFTPTGFPVWIDFISKVLEVGDPRIDDLVREESEIVALCQSKESLMEELLPVFGKESGLYRILGQLIVGYLPLPRASAGRTVVTVQAVQCLDQGRPRLFLNLIGKTPSHENIVDYLRVSPEPELEGLLKTAEKKLRAAKYKPSTRSAGSGGLETAILTILRHLGRSIERTNRRNRRRTRHATQRGSERPAVGLALKDIDKAQPDRFLYDEIHNTFIVVGPKWRIHIFGQDGRHVTSMHLNRDSFQKRLDTRRWRFATPEEMQSTLSKVDAVGKRDP
ncbi:MAG: hypothetical protein ABIK28_05140 [Planctomycetota bacterium]